ncbi:MAG: GreA/GreB family elongation factor [Nitrospinota bacterium]
MFYVTRKSWMELCQRLDQLEKRVRIDMADEIKHAASYGDFAENSELDAAREKQQLLTLEVQRLREKLNQSQIIDDLDIDPSRVSIGTCVTLYDLGKKEENKWTILGEEESKPAEGVISHQSPLARALLGKEEGDEVSIQLPRGLKKFEIVAVEKAQINPPDSSPTDGRPDVSPPPMT